MWASGHTYDIHIYNLMCFKLSMLVFKYLHHTRLVGGQRLVTVLKTPLCILLLINFSLKGVHMHPPPPTGLTHTHRPSHIPSIARVEAS